MTHWYHQAIVPSRCLCVLTCNCILPTRELGFHFIMCTTTGYGLSGIYIYFKFLPYVACDNS